MMPVGAFSLLDATRHSDIGVAADSNAELGLVVNETVQNCQRQDLVNVTNGFDQGIDVTVTLVDGSIGTLYNTVNGESGDSVTFPLAAGEAGTVELDADHTGGTPHNFSFDISAVGSGLSVTATRSSTLEGDGSCSGGGPGGGPA